MRLNGWQRLWVVASLVYAVVLGIKVYSDNSFWWPDDRRRLVFWSWPSEGRLAWDWRRDYSRALEREVLKALNVADPACRPSRDFSDQLIYRDDFLPARFGDRAEFTVGAPCAEREGERRKVQVRVPLRTVELQAINDDYRRSMESLTGEQMRAAATLVFILWLLPVAAAFLAGVAVKWVVAGFVRRGDGTAS